MSDTQNMTETETPKTGSDAEPGFLEAFLDNKPEPAAERDPELEFHVIEMVQTIYDPEIPVNIYELGLIYELTADVKGNVKVIMTLTTPHCPVAESMPGEVETRIRGVEGVNDVSVELTWEPAWDQSMMSEAARLELGFL
ncbi:DUF59 domain-containing protein [Govanella unica]|uniref:DUF59 domain-containing protein n=1 Tax=Govanella unica TaxID=2975056 RepID=A0A9X3TVB9_9PROT|nr:DUF59 domain-containing protein [Govania unica]MDA5192398.1 DUF59 domain-containing protein [Govania unica]